MKVAVSMALASAGLLAGPTGKAGERVIASADGCPYQIVCPDAVAHPALGQTLSNAAALLQEALAANGWAVPVVRESEAEPGRPSFYLGDTAAARAAGLAPDAFPVWAYAWKVAGPHVIVAGRDWAAAPVGGGGGTPCSHGTAKGLLDFLRVYAGVRFLAPGGPPGIEFLPVARVAVPDDLEVRREPLLRYHSGGKPRADLALMALNFLDNVTTEYFAHTHELAVPAETYAATHPEYFALVNGKRIREYKHGWLGMVKEPHLCYSNPEVQELIYRDMLRSFDAGYPDYLSLQADGFQPCECDACKALFDTDDWGEKLWRLNRQWAERLLRDRPGRFLVVTAYTVTGKPPSFREFPPNLRVAVGGYPQAFETWSACAIPGGFVSYLHAWGGYHLCGYLPVRTPLYAEKTVKLFAANAVRGVGLDSEPANLWALEGPTVYTYGRMLDDPATNAARELVAEYVAAAYGRAAPAMTRFFDTLHHALEIYAEVFGVDNGTFQTYRRADGRSVRYLTWQDKLRLIGFLYPPETLALLEEALAQAERTAGLSDKQALRLKLARREFDYLRGTARVVHCYQAYRTRADRVSFVQLLDEMDARRRQILAWYEPRREYKPGIYLQQPIATNWSLYIGGAGHYNDHLLRNGGSYLSAPVPPFTWDIDAMRQAPLLDPPRLAVARVAAPPDLDAAVWQTIATHALGPVALGGKPPEWATAFQAACDGQALYVRFEGRLPEGWVKPPAFKRDDPAIPAHESFGVALAPDGNPARFLRFAGGPDPDAAYEARRGFVEDAIDPRFDRDDPAWNPDWRYACAVAGDGRSWRALLAIPFASLEAPAPAAGAEWRANFGRVHETRRSGGAGETSLWSANPDTAGIDDARAFGVLRFE